MTAEASPLPVSARRSRRRELLDLLASMRFAIALLTVICIASAIGTVVKQGEPMVNYVDQFGPFWAEVFGAIGLYRIYSSAWFLVILAFLVVSTSLCIARNTPKIVADWRAHKEGIRERALQAFHHKAMGQLTEPVSTVEGQVLQTLQAQGWSIKTQRREASPQGEAGVMIAARLGKANKVGYIAAHAAIVLVCLGGLFDGDLVVKAQAWAQDLQPFKGGTEPANSRLSERNPAYRAQLFVSEGQRTNASVIQMDQGMLVQPLPFDIELKKFVVEYYETGMPKRFASDIVIHDPRVAAPKAYTVEVNHPVVYDGVTIFQSSFEDGGSLVKLRPLHLDRAGPRSGPEVVDAMVGGGAPGALPADWLGQGSGPLQLEVTGLRVINVENLADAQSANPAGASTDVRGVNLTELSKHLGSGAKPAGKKQLVNIGPSVTYKLRDAAGQAREYQNFMVPVELDGYRMFLLGVRDTPAEGFRYLRVPADEAMSLQGWLRLRQALNNKAMRDEAARRFGAAAGPGDRPEVREQLTVSAQRSLDLFAGAVALEMPAGQAAASVPSGGLMGLSRFIEQVVPPEQREQTSGTLIRILNGALFELYNLSRTQAGLAAVSLDEPAVQAFMGRAVLSLSDAMLYPVPVVFMLDSFEQRQASVFQVTRTPGRNVVYLGCVLLIIGVFAMLYIRDRRLWVWLQQDPQGGTRVQMALSSTRQTLDTDREFDRLRQTVLGEAPASAAGPTTKEI
ncbi:MAG: cytochrome c biogenesis protein ResB [Aquabacterium sp.]|jgi:cytochrome c biogenesis protein|uniref:cytochrome c biogenesis protein ResB n=1 Tax=Aquabacterium sp. TaxID=1872578 RepID=UPI002A36FAFB|nr:cytochrome c biogenesis protein ResB [Aquabacterium sp.]MDX9844116.1 cytochrome c biogenesis protein ResB [Aquabacterium sp.]